MSVKTSIHNWQRVLPTNKHKQVQILCNFQTEVEAYFPGGGGGGEFGSQFCLYGAIHLIYYFII